MPGRSEDLIETGAYWLLYVASVSGALLHWRYGNELFAVACVLAAVLSALLINRGRHDVAAPP